MILNPTSLLKKAKEQLKSYSEINLFLENDNAGRKCKSELLELFPDAKDYSGLYAPLKDLNDYLIYKTGIKTKTAEVKTELNSKSSRRQFASQIEPAEFIQQKSLPIPRLQKQVPNEHKNQEETINQEKQQEQTTTQNRQSYRRRR
ncbi:toprim domain-containing protein [Chryseobacterium sp. MA9]|uniref:toprim domain-containing protein n=1 Tax=Chryseobacterium sp. MA9 TaxID=2966625 RepID=UPI0021035330|nr:toprim domain-containing protein [Chryseobacterium sp. MA9]UTX48915.1 toprim domain-containing protein [Chryseobacterium sp. MA9]